MPFHEILERHSKLISNPEITRSFVVLIRFHRVTNIVVYWLVGDTLGICCIQAVKRKKMLAYLENCSVFGKALASMKAQRSRHTYKLTVLTNSNPVALSSFPQAIHTQIGENLTHVEHKGGSKKQSMADFRLEQNLNSESRYTFSEIHNRHRKKLMINLITKLWHCKW